MSPKKVRCAYTNEEQKKLLIEFVGRNPDLQSGKFSNTFTTKDAQKCWEEIATELNKVPGAEKEWKQWRKAWQDMRYAAKAKNSAIKKSAKQTGGGPPTSQILTDTDQNVLSLICSTVLDGHANVHEPDAVFMWNDDPSEELEYLEEEKESVIATLRPELLEEPIPSTSFNAKENIQTVGPPCTSNSLSQIANKKTLKQTSAAKSHRY
ncbi:uncharacterized protein LOC122501854 [Leptopilina heterotoma]|uniref:uncharacterized protein LOC122501854 n=1 Tax=Leptopilina heterotoma TaxID=63436 RepID=UPI001CA8D6F9|nr:uncharacterized protein LOC122501854 [Leptopilina heterotoma]